MELAATSWRGHSSLGLRAVTGADGRFLLENAPHDEFEVAVRAPGGGSVTRTVRADRDASIDITLPDAMVDVEPGAVGRIGVGDTAPVLQVTTLDGTVIDFRSLKGKTTLLDFWATWCAPCLVDIPHLRVLQERNGGREDFIIIAVSLDSDERALTDFIKKRGIGWHNVYGEAGGAHVAADRYGVTAIPAMFLIGPDGKLVASGPHYSDIEEKIEKMLEDYDPT